MKRLFAVFVLFAVACFLSGAYGALHNQISYSVSHEYFTKFKFAQFGITPELQNRLGAAIVGWQASWWMGVVIGIFVIPFGLLVRDTRSFIVAVLRSFLVIVLTTLVTGLTALLVAHLVIPTSPSEEWTFRGVAIADAASFRRTGTMHNFSYIGGLLGIATGMASILRSFLAENASLNFCETEATP